jgi:hypothetical protein
LIELPLVTAVAVAISVGVGVFARIARNRSFFLWALITLAVLVGGELIISATVRFMLTGLEGTTPLAIVVYFCFGAVMLLSAFIMPSAESDADD